MSQVSSSVPQQDSIVSPTKPGQVFTVRNGQGYETSFESAKWSRLQNNTQYPITMRDRLEDMVLPALAWVEV